MILNCGLFTIIGVDGEGVKTYGSCFAGEDRIEDDLLDPIPALISEGDNSLKRTSSDMIKRLD